MARVNKRVAILGGGVAGMSAAHELIERGFDVDVYERKPFAGGKARSIDFRLPAPAGRPGARPLPGEHGFRFFPRFYKHVIDTMERIPFRGGSVAQNLVDTTRLQIARFDAAPFALPARWPRAPNDVRVVLSAFTAFLAGQVDLSVEDAAFFADKMWRFVTSCEERRLIEYERINWWDFIEAGQRSASYQKYYGNGITRSLVAAKARRASAKTIGDIFVQIVFDILRPGVSADRVLNGPTNDVWIAPWLEHLRARGVAYHTDADVRAIHCDRGRVTSATVAMGGALRQIGGDHFICAMPVERMTELVSPALLEIDPSLANLDELTEYVEWMNGIQFYLNEDIPLAPGHTIYIDSPWALTSISQPQFWKGVDLTKYGDGCVKGLLSVDISDWDVKGLNGKEARQCSRAEIAAEVWEQMKRSLNGPGRTVLEDENLHAWFLDPDIEDLDPAASSASIREVNMEPLLVNYVDTWRLRPEAMTRVPNLFLASDYVRTFTDLATMEAANEAARRAVNGVLRASRVDAAPCGVWNLHEPEVFLPLRAYDRARFRQGLPWDGTSMAFAEALALTGGGEAPPVDAQAETAAAARSSSDAGLDRLRITKVSP